MRLPLYQTEWFGLSLEKISRDLDQPLSHLPNAVFYKHLYKKILDGQGTISPSYIKLKENLALWIADYLKKRGLETSKLLSLGCGLGVLERKLIQCGLQVDLQECQDLSIQYLQKQDPDVFQNSTFMCSEDLSGIEKESYKVTLAIIVAYCLDDVILAHFLERVHQILMPGGIFLLHDIALGSLDVEVEVKRRLLRQPHVGKFWGWKRSARTMIRAAKRVGLLFDTCVYFDDASNEVVKPRTVASMPLRRDVRGVVIVMRKRG